eukprot:tig00020780_g13801.t1
MAPFAEALAEALVRGEKAAWSDVAASVRADDWNDAAASVLASPFAREGLPAAAVEALARRLHALDAAKWAASFGQDMLVRLMAHGGGQGGGATQSRTLQLVVCVQRLRRELGVEPAVAPLELGLVREMLRRGRAGEVAERGVQLHLVAAWEALQAAGALDEEAAGDALRAAVRWLAELRPARGEEAAAFTRDNLRLARAAAALLGTPERARLGLHELLATLLAPRSAPRGRRRGGPALQPLAALLQRLPAAQHGPDAAAFIQSVAPRLPDAELAAALGASSAGPSSPPSVPRRPRAGRREPPGPRAGRGAGAWVEVLVGALKAAARFTALEAACWRGGGGGDAGNGAAAPGGGAARGHRAGPALFHAALAAPPFLDALRRLRAEQPPAHAALAPLLHALMYAHPGRPELYVPLLDALAPEAPPPEAEMRAILADAAWRPEPCPGAAPLAAPLWAWAGRRRAGAREPGERAGLVNLGNTCAPRPPARPAPALPA